MSKLHVKFLMNCRETMIAANAIYADLYAESDGSLPVSLYDALVHTISFIGIFKFLPVICPKCAFFTIIKLYIYSQLKY